MVEGMTESQWQHWFADQLRSLSNDLNDLRDIVATKQDLHEAMEQVTVNDELRHKAVHERHLRLDHILTDTPRRVDDPGGIDMRPLRNDDITNRRVWVMWGVGIFMLVLIAEQISRIVSMLVQEAFK